MGWWSGTDKSSGEKVSYKHSRDAKDESYRAEKLTHHKDGGHTHEVVKTNPGGGSKSFIFGGNRNK